MKKIIPLLFLPLVITLCHAKEPDVIINTGHFYGVPGQLFDIQAKYYMTYHNQLNTIKTYCYRLDLCIQGYGCTTKSLEECINVNAHHSRTIGKELHYVRTIDIPGRYEISAQAMVDGKTYKTAGHIIINNFYKARKKK